MYRTNQNLEPGRASLQHIENVTNGGATGRGDNPDPPREPRQGTFAFRREESFGLKLPFQRFEFGLKNAQPSRLKKLHAKLILAARFKD